MTEIPRRQTLRKHERLYEKKLLDLIFQKGKSVSNPPVKLLWVTEKHESKTPLPKGYIGIKVAFSVPKKIFKKAVTRNLLKRRMREAYRKNKLCKAGTDETYALFFIYIGNKINPYAEIESKIVVTLQHFKTATGAE